MSLTSVRSAASFRVYFFAVMTMARYDRFWTTSNGYRAQNESPDSLLLPPVKWGRPDVVFTPAYWADQVAVLGRSVEPGTHRLGKTLIEECVACLLGGYGIPAEVGLAAFEAIRNEGLLAAANVTPEDVFNVLYEPLALPSGNQVRYRFARQKSRYIANLLSRFSMPARDASNRSIRDWLTSFSGVGLKTASWIVRNWYDADDVAVIDVHIHRAGLLAGFYGSRDRLPRDYISMERRFLSFAAAIGTRASLLDAVIWFQMRQAGALVKQSLGSYHTLH